MGRKKKEDVWKLFKKGPLRDNNKLPASCRFCAHQTKTANITRMTEHIKKCVNCPLDIKEELFSSFHEKSSSDCDRDPFKNIKDQPMDETQYYEDIASTSGTENLNDSNPAGLESFVFSAVQKKEKGNLDAHLAKAIFVSEAPLSMVEHPLWISFFKLLQPAYKLPTQKHLSTKLLDQVYNEIMRERTKELKKATDLHLQCDGWSNSRNEPIINFYVKTPDPLFVKFLNTEDKTQTAEYIFEEIMKVLKEYGEENFFVIVGDNARNIQAAFRKVITVYPYIVPLGCVSHSLNLLCNDLLKCDSLKNLIETVVHIVQAIKNSPFITARLSAIIKAKNIGEQLQLPCKTRWGSYNKSLESFQNTKVPLQSMAVNENAGLTSEIKHLLLDDTFWIMVADAVSLFQPICKWICELESNSRNIHKVWKAYSDIGSLLATSLLKIGLLNNTEKGTVLYRLLERKTECIKPIHLAAYLLDPTCQGRGLDEGEEAAAMEFIQEVGQSKNLEIMPHLAMYRSKEGPLFGKTCIWASAENLEPVSWWKGLCKSNTLSVVAVRILTAPSISAATECSLSNFGGIQPKTINQFTANRAVKISYLKYNWMLKNPDKIVNRTDSSTESEDTDADSENSSQSVALSNRVIQSDDSDSD